RTLSPPLFPYTTLFRSVHPVGQQDHERGGVEVDHQRGAGEAGVTGGPDRGESAHVPALVQFEAEAVCVTRELLVLVGDDRGDRQDRKSTRLNSSHVSIS